MEEFVKISDSENEVMEVMWELGEANVPAVHKKLSEHKKWAYNTVGTFMQRLCEKGLLQSHKDGKTNVYSVVISREEYKKAVTRDFLNSIHKGSKKSLIASLFNKKLSAGDIDKLFEIIDKNQ